MVRWHTTKTYAELKAGRAAEPLSIGGDSEPIQVQYELLGFGPRFRLQIQLVASA